MKISEIRATIRAADWTRRDLTGGTREEFRRQAVGPALARHVAALRALDIAPRFARDIEDRDHAIAACEHVITRWEAAQPVQVARAGYDRIALVFADGSRVDVPADQAQVYADRLGVVIANHREIEKTPSNVIDASARFARAAA